MESIAASTKNTPTPAASPSSVPTRFATRLRSAFKDNEWRYTTTPARKGEAHLAKLNRAELPTFGWPPEVIAAFEEEEARREKSGKDKR